jgi:hypothetical protein
MKSERKVDKKRPAEILHFLKEKNRRKVILQLPESLKLAIRRNPGQNLKTWSGKKSKERLDLRKE